METLKVVAVRQRLQRCQTLLVVAAAELPDQNVDFLRNAGQNPVAKIVQDQLRAQTDLAVRVLKRAAQRGLGGQTLLPEKSGRVTALRELPRTQLLNRLDDRCLGTR